MLAGSEVSFIFPYSCCLRKGTAKGMEAQMLSCRIGGI